MWVKPAELKPWAKNPRRNDGAVDAIAKSIERYGFGAPIVARKATREIIGGHTRWKAAQKLGLAQVPVRFLDISERDAHALALADNKLGELSEWDDEQLAELLQSLEPAEQLIAGWSPDEVRELLAEVNGSPDVTEDEVPDPPKVPVTQPGDIWELGRHRLVCGDCRNPDDVARVCDGARVNLAFTSPPYASQRKYDESSGFKPIHPDEYVAWFEPVQANMRRVLADDGSWFVNIKEHCDEGQRSLYVKDLAIAHVRQWGWRYIDEFAWVHGGTPTDVERRFKNGWEPVFQYAVRHGFKFHPDDVRHHTDSARGSYAEKKRGRIDTAKSQGNTGDIFANPELGPGLAYPSNALRMGKNAESLGHPAAFPVALPSFFVRAYTDSGDTVLDPFIGSGTTLIAAEQLDRRCFGIELSPAYCDVIIQRWEQLSGGKATRL